MTFGLASREMSLVAVVRRAGDRPGELPETRVVPVGMPQNTAFSAYFDRPATGMAVHRRTYDSLVCDRSFAGMAIFKEVAVPPGIPDMGFEEAIGEQAHALIDRIPLQSRRKPPLATPSVTTSTKVDLVELAAMLEPDGGMPGESLAVRAGRTIAAVLAFAAEGHTLTAGAFRLHVTRLVRFLESLRAASDSEVRLIDTALGAASTGRVPTGQWLLLARDPGTGWKQIEAVLPLQ
jgi:hypothetical protein